MPEKKIHILVAPLDWGIGHATRCVPIIRMLLQKGALVTIAATGQSQAFLKLEFPEVNFIPSPGFKITYPERGSMALKMALSAPGFLAEIYREHHWLDGLINELELDAVISDNRFGLWNKKIPTIYLTHQVAIMMPRGMKNFEPLAYRAHRQFIDKYTTCWIPDTEGEVNLSGKLSHGYMKPGNASYIGPLSRFMNSMHIKDPAPEKDGLELLAVLSGPEPQRSILENIIRKESVKHPGMKVALIQGIPALNGIDEEGDGLKVYSHLADHQLATLIKNAHIVLCRPGYSSVMDLVFLGKKAVFVPTPGQTEQEYLGKYLSEKKWFHSLSQDGLTFDKVRKINDQETLPLPEFGPGELLEKHVDSLLYSLG